MTFQANDTVTIPGYEFFNGKARNGSVFSSFVRQGEEFVIVFVDGGGSPMEFHVSRIEAAA